MRNETEKKEKTFEGKSIFALAPYRKCETQTTRRPHFLFGFQQVFSFISEIYGYKLRDCAEIFFAKETRKKQCCKILRNRIRIVHNLLKL